MSSAGGIFGDSGVGAWSEGRGWWMRSVLVERGQVGEVARGADAVDANLRHARDELGDPGGEAGDAGSAEVGPQRPDRFPLLDGDELVLGFDGLEEAVVEATRIAPRLALFR